MGALNFLKAEWTCPFCGTKQSGEIQFKYGPTMHYRFQVGDKIDWEKPGYIGEKRFPEGTGELSGVAICVNALGRESAPLKERAKCPNVIEVLISIEQDVIKSIVPTRNPT